MTMVHDLLLEPILTWRDVSRKRQAATLPGVLAHLASGALVDFARVRPHQLHAWTMFLAQLAAIALQRAGESDPRIDEATWRRRLLAITNGDSEPWCLAVNDLKKPAFMQAPVPEGAIDAWNSCGAPDDIDVLITAKNHDIKTELLAGDDIESWTYALVTVQTMQGYPGRGYNGVARMNRGYGSRACVGMQADITLSARFRRDVEVLLGSWDKLLLRGFGAEGLCLVWLEPWDGRKALSFQQLSPHFIEICQRLRLVDGAGRVRCAYTTSVERRCLPEVDNGDVGDPWIPLEVAKGAISVGRRGFDYQLVQKLLFDGDVVRPAAQELRPGDASTMLFSAAVLSRGQGKTDGLHERILELPAVVRRRLGQSTELAAIAERSRAQIQDTEKMRSKVLYPALRTLATGEAMVPDKLHERVDDCFFDHLFATLEETASVARTQWIGKLRELARAELERAIGMACLSDARHWKAVSAAESMFGGCLRKQFPDLTADPQHKGEME